MFLFLLPTAENIHAAEKKKKKCDGDMKVFSDHRIRI